MDCIGIVLSSMYEAGLDSARTELNSITWSEVDVAVVKSLVSCIAVVLAAVDGGALPTALTRHGTDVITAFDRLASVLTLG